MRVVEEEARQQRGPAAARAAVRVGRCAGRLRHVAEEGGEADRGPVRGTGQYGLGVRGAQHGERGRRQPYGLPVPHRTRRGVEDLACGGEEFAYPRPVRALLRYAHGGVGEGGEYGADAFGEAAGAP
ncbi:hypothetical protein DSC45_25130 [Streptomyces sp. YIM 130001]|nr:hypothetical protein DSC45_25130 [Streptomyces sp. YIM 130001]